MLDERWRVQATPQPVPRARGDAAGAEALDGGAVAAAETTQNAAGHRLLLDGRAPPCYAVRMDDDVPYTYTIRLAATDIAAIEAEAAHAVAAGFPVPARALARVLLREGIAARKEKRERGER